MESVQFVDLMSAAYEISEKAWQEGRNDIMIDAAVKGFLAEAAGPISAAAANGYATLKIAQWQRVVAAIPDLFKQFLGMPNPADFDPAVQRLNQAWGILSTGSAPTSPQSSFQPANSLMSQMNTVGRLMAGWRGTAAETFQTEYVDKFPSLLANQEAVTVVLKRAVEAERAMWSAARADICNIAEQTLLALDHVDDCRQSEFTMIFTVVSSVAAVVAALATDGAALPLVAAIVSAGSQVAAAVPIREPELKISGSTAAAVVQSMQAAIADALKHINEAETQIADLLAQARQAMDGREKELLPRRPQLADATSANVRSDEYMGESND